MGLVDAVREFLTLGTMHEPERRELSLDWPPIEAQVARVMDRATQWTPASVREATGVPAIFRARSMLATLIGSLTMKALRNEVEMAPADRPQIIKRPDPRRIPRDFFRDTGWNMTGWGEAWWWVSARDGDGLASALYNVPDPREVSVEQSDDPTRPHISWRGRTTRDGSLRREDMRQLTYVMSDDGLRGVGPLQLCGVATSVAVESERWASNFYAGGGTPPIVVRYNGQLSGDPDGYSTEEQVDANAESEVRRFKYEWMRSEPNTPRVVDDNIGEIEQFNVNEQGAQMLLARYENVGEAARLYGVPGALLEYGRPGSSLTYQNLADVFTQLARTTMRPVYLEPIEQTMSDLLTRSTVARFDTEVIEAPDVKTRFEVYGLGIANGIIDAAYAQAKEGIRPGDVENAAIPQPNISVTVPRLMSIDSPQDVRCTGSIAIRGKDRTCNRLLSTTGHFEGICPKCKAAYPAVA